MRMTRELRVPGKYDVKVGGRRLNSNGKPTHVPKPLTAERKALAEQWTGLVVWAVNEWHPDAKWHARDELKSIASLALVEAAERYDPARGVQFNTFALNWIWGRLKTATAATGAPSVQFVLVPGGGREEAIAPAARRAAQAGRRPAGPARLRQRPGQPGAGQGPPGR